MAFNAALVRAKIDNNDYEYIGLYFYTKIEDLLVEVCSATDFGEDCEYLPAEVQTAAGLNFTGNVSETDWETFILHINTTGSILRTTDTTPPNPLEQMKYKGLSEGFLACFIEPMMKGNWSRFKSE